MNEENSNQPVDINDDNQSEFEELFYAPEPEEVEDVEDVVEEDAEEIDDLGEDDDPPASEDEDEDEPEEDKSSKGKENRVQKRINELTAKARQEEREKLALLKRLEELEAVVKRETEKDQKPLRQQLPTGAPKPDAVDDTGEPLYPLGEFDPNYIADLTEFTVEQRLKAADEKRAAEEQARQVQAAQEEIRDAWIERVNEAEKELPDLREHIVELTDTFEDLPPQYGEYLATTIMASEFGPQIMYYLSQNIGEAQRIVASGPHAATLALGRLEAMFSNPSTEKPEKKRNTKQVSKAPVPPEESTRGRGSSTAVAPDTDNLDAFEKVFYQK